MELKLGEFYFNGKSSLDFGIYAKYIIPFSPPKRLRRISIPGVNGTYDYGTKNFDDIGITLECYCKKEYDRSTFREVVYWLSKKGRLYIWDDQDKYYIAEYQTEPSLTWQNLSHMNPFRLNFLCEPFAYKDDEKTPLQMGENVVKYNGTYEARPILRLYNTSNSDIVNLSLTLVEKEENI